MSNARQRGTDALVRSHYGVAAQPSESFDSASHPGKTPMDLVEELSEETKEELRRLLAPGRTALMKGFGERWKTD